MTIETITLNSRASDSATLDLITDIQYLEPFTSTSLNRKFCGVVRPGVFRGFSCEPGNGLTLNIKHTQNQDGNEVKYGVALVERDDYLLTVRQQNDIAINIPTGQVMYVVLEAFYQFGVETKQVNLDSDVDSATVRVLPQSQVKDHHVILCTANIPDSATQLLAEHLSFDGRMLGGYDLDSHLSDTHPHKQYVRNDADSVVNANLRLSDSYKLSLGNGDDLALHHDGTNSVIESKTGDLFLKQNAAGKGFNLQVKNASGSLVNSLSVVGGANPYVKLRHSNTTRLMTTGGGVAVTGDIIVSGEVHDSGARVFSPSNRNISDSATTVSSTVYASLTSVKKAYDRAIAAENNSKAHTEARISDLLGGAASEALDTIKELGDALLNQGDAVTVITNNIAEHKANKSNPHGVTKAQVGLGNVPNYGFTSSVSDASNTKFASAGAVKKAYDLALTKITKAQGDNYYLAIGANAKSASKWATARTITLHGDLSGSVSLDGSANVTLSAAVKNDSHTHSYILATDDRDVKPSTTGLDKKHAAKVYFVSLRGMNGESGSSDYQDLMVFDTYTDATGGNVNAITLDKRNGAMRLWSAEGDATAWGTGQRVFADNYHPNADKWTNARTLELTGDVSGSVSFDGSKNVTLNVTVGDDSHTHDTRYHTKAEVDSIKLSLQSQIDSRVTYAVAGLPNDGRYKAAGKTSSSETLDFNDIDQAGIYKNLTRSDSINRPDNNTGFAYIQNYTYGSTSNVTQLAIPYGVTSRSGRIAIRSRYSGEWQPWDYLYSTQYKPTPDEIGALPKGAVASDVGALSLAGGTLTGGLFIDEGASNVSQLHLGHAGKRFHVETKTDGTFEIVESDVSSRLKIRKGGESTLYGSLNATESVSSNRSVEVQGTKAGNTVPSSEQVKLDGYGVIGNRRAVYFTNGSNSSDAYVQIAVGGAHNGGVAKLDLTRSELNSNVPIKIQGQKVITEATNRTKVVRTSLGSDNSWCLVANVTMPQSSSTAVIEFFGGAGFNTDLHYQSSRHQMILRASNGNPKGLNGQVITDHPSGLPFSEFGWVNTGGDNYAIYVKTRSAYSTNILIRYMCSHAITPYVSNKGASQPAGIAKGRMVTSYTSYNKDLGAINSVDGKGLELDYSSMKTWIGSRNTSWCHLQTEAPGGFYFYNPIVAASGVNVNLNKTLDFGGKSGIRATDGSWLRINDLGEFTSGIFCGNSLLRTDGEITVGSWSGSNDAVRMENNFADTSWASNGRAGFSINVEDSQSAHWALASYYDGTNIRAGIQILSNSDGRMRFYTNRRSNYVEVYGGNVYAGSPQSSAGHSLTRKDYVDSKLAGVSSRAGEAAIGSGGQLKAGNLTVGSTTWEYKDWIGKYLDPFDLVNYNAPVAGFDIRVEGYYEIEWTPIRRRNATNDAVVYSAITKNGVIISESESLTNDYCASTITCRWVGKLYYGELIQFLDRGASTAIKGSHFSIRYIKP
ncbi:tail fiber protein [Vibrio diabolicus]|uniref:tail fiber protein n=1 Tax=Vibrio diabolicus TaxID=50719 RepID=UPI003D7D5AC7